MAKNKNHPHTDMDIDEDILSLHTPSHDEKAPTHTHPAYKALETKLHAVEAELRTANTALEEHKKEQENQLLRHHAELENVRKRARKEIEEAHRYGVGRFAEDLIPVGDSLEGGMSIEVGDNAFAKQIHTGVEMTLKLLLDTLEKYGIKQIYPLGHTFDPTLHQAISMREDSSAQANTVLEVLQKGYQLHDRLIRPALVVVAK